MADVSSLAAGAAGADHLMELLLMLTRHAASAARITAVIPHFSRTVR